MVKAVIFDCFGVIVGKGFEYTFMSAGGDPERDKEFVEDMLTQANLGLISEQEFNKVMAKHLDKTDEEWQAAIKAAEEADEELLNYITAIKAKYKTAVLSNSNKGVLSAKIGEGWLDTCFDQVVCSAEVGLIKPNPDIYKLAAEWLEVEPNECVFIDDHQSFVRAAEDVGMHGLVYKDLPSLKNELTIILSR